MLERVALFKNFKHLALFISACFGICLLSLSIEYNNYSKLTAFDDALVEATVINQYTKTKNSREYQVLKLKTDDGASFYMSAQPYIRDLSGYRVKVWLKSDDVSFVEYLRGFFAIAHIKEVSREQVLRYRVAKYLESQHTDSSLGKVSAALICATPIDKQTRDKLSALGISHLLAISGFHLGVLSVVLFFLLKLPYRSLQNRYFPYRHGNRDLFIVVALLLGAYTLFLGLVPSVLRAFVMMLIGFVLFDRGVKIVSIQTLVVSVLLIIALFPKLLFSIGLWLSVGGVYYIFLFLMLTEGKSKVFQFIALHVWVYVMMLPLSLYLFNLFSVYHPLSILWTMLFVIFYPLVLLLHIFGAGEVVDIILEPLFGLGVERIELGLSVWIVGLFLIFSLLAARSRVALLMMITVAFGVSIYALSAL